MAKKNVNHPPDGDALNDRRAEIIREIQESLQEHKAGQSRPVTSEELMKELFS